MRADSLFLSYRRQDSGGHAGRLFDRLVARFGADHVFMDVQDIQPGENFETAIEQTLARCTHLVAVIGPRWLDMLREREAQGADLVQHEISVALRRGLTVIPVLVGGARMPATDDLPPALAALTRCQAVEARDNRFDDDVATLVRALDADLAGTGGGVSRRAVIGGLVGVLALGAVALLTVPWLTRAPQPTLSGEWLAEMKKGTQPPFRIRLRLTQSGERLTGLVSYPTGDAPLIEGHVDATGFSFTTEHTPQFADGPARIRFVGEWAGDDIRLTSTDEGGVGTGTGVRSGEGSGNN